MKRRDFLLSAGAWVSAGAALSSVASAAVAAPASPGRAAPGPSVPVITPNGWSLPSRWVKGAREFHLVAEEVRHEFAPGSVARCWGYNGGTPGPTLEAIQGETVRLYVTNTLPEPTTVHWHGLRLPCGMDGVAGLTQPAIPPGATFVYEFELSDAGTFMYHPHANEMTQMALGLMGMFIVHPQGGDPAPVDRDYVFLLHNWALPPGSERPDPSVMTDFDLWTMNGKVFPSIDPVVAATGERVRIRLGNLSMWNHPMHMHGVHFDVTGNEAGRWPSAQWRREVTEIVAVGQTRDLEFDAVAGDWAFHCHMSHHTMNAMGHEITNPVGVQQQDLQGQFDRLLPGHMAMGDGGMIEHQQHVEAGHMPGPPNTLAMMAGHGQFGAIGMGGMMTVVKVRDGLPKGSTADPGHYRHPAGTVARAVDQAPPLVRRPQ